MLVSATVGLLLKLIENAGEKVGEIVSGLLGTAWSVMTYFVVPILVVEKIGPFDAVSRSVSIMKRTWGEALVGKVGMGLFLFLLSLPIFGLGIVGFIALAHSPLLGAIILCATGITFLIYLAVSAAMHTIFLTAVYQYATSERVPEGFNQERLAHASASK